MDLVFKVNLDLQALEKDQAVPDYVKKTLKQLDDYSIHLNGTLFSLRFLVSNIL